MHTFLGLLILVTGGASGLYAWNPRWFGVDAENAAQRPWRRLGAAICTVVAVMFFLGAILLDEGTKPSTYVGFWSILLGLVFWVLMLALKDMRFTLKQYHEDRVRLREGLRGRGRRRGDGNDADGSG
ncbi:MAG: hypothetical protein FLDDKLPJ_00542 [Phycisphaerae bacterium]|nr:hypothetical protein [Phycisphaerae bacterium]